MLLQSSALSLPLPPLLPMMQVYVTVPLHSPALGTPFDPCTSFGLPLPAPVRLSRAEPAVDARGEDDPEPDARPSSLRTWDRYLRLCTTSITTTRTCTLILLYPGPVPCCCHCQIESAHPHPRRLPTPPHARITNITSSRASRSPPTPHCGSAARPIW
ncbi:hypothetical protein FIBSPDRAFT_878900 [Athelia psychrophila]|uniref:Uncharacterized protein n=1 Tax=Athelia psychrophila TaxID=1759441 RepID=A0A167UL06_9AGAM|nr:hypothetical protein FIBSPDRAFT_878900 [Fibularhizoctonia sp. CBS 109695]